MKCLIRVIPGIAELALELSYKTKKKLINDNLDTKEQKNNIQYLLEFISASNMVLILKDVKNWLNEDEAFYAGILKYGDDKDRVINILDAVPQCFRDRHWHAVT